MKVGKLNLSSKAIVAPMAEVTDAPFRQICREYGAGLTFTQMVSAKGIVDNSFDSLKVLAFNRSEKPIGVQLLANDPEYVQKAITELKSLNPDLIDLNCGCSVAAVCRYDLGAAILDNPVLLGELVKSMKDSAGDIPVSVKIRLGRDKNNINVVKNAEIVEKNGASQVIVHARVRSDSYAVKSAWRWIGDVKKAVSIPVIGNGSLFEPSDCINMINETGCDGVLLARGILGNPFVFRRFNSIIDTGTDPGFPDVDDFKSAALHHLDLIRKDSGDLNGPKKARKYLVWYFRFFNGIYEFVNGIYNVDSFPLMEEFINEHVEKIKNHFYPEENLEKIKNSFNERVLFWMNTVNKSEADNY